ncbi:Uncharacterised protein [Vibrio cholerae]|nr:Uncharacterised protein [Vibrio cholerae]
MLNSYPIPTLLCCLSAQGHKSADEHPRVNQCCVYCFPGFTFFNAASNEAASCSMRSLSCD